MDCRIFARVPVNLPLRFLQRGRLKACEANAVDISANGIGFVSKIRLATDTPLEMWLKPQDKHGPLYVIGKVIWSKSLGLDPPKWRIGVYCEKANLMDFSRIFRKN